MFTSCAEYSPCQCAIKWKIQGVSSLLELCGIMKRLYTTSVEALHGQNTPKARGENWQANLLKTPTKSLWICEQLHGQWDCLIHGHHNIYHCPGRLQVEGLLVQQLSRPMNQGSCVYQLC